MVDDRLPPNYKKEFPGMILRHGFRELDEHSDVETAAGWVNLMDPLDAQFQGQEYFKEGYIAMSLRVDVRRVPAKALRQHCLVAEREAKASDKAPFLSKSRRQEIREQTRWQLMRRVIPRSNTYDMVWDPARGVVLFASLNTATRDLFVELFHKTFQLGLLPVFPHSLASLHLGRLGADLTRLDDLRPFSFARR
jgi:DNA recombination-dependent growth factor C